MLFCLACLLPGLACAAPRQLTLPLTPRGPELRGDLSAPGWQQAARVEAFVAADGLSRPRAATEALALADAEALYLGFVCHEPDVTKLLAEVTDRDGTVWADDCSEVTLDPTRGAAGMYHWAVNARGAIWDGLHGPRGALFAHNSQATAKCSVGADRWRCELRVPWADVGSRPLPGEV